MTLQHLYTMFVEELDRCGYTMDTEHILIGSKYFNIKADLEGLHSHLHATLVTPDKLHLAMEHAAGTRIARAMEPVEIGTFILELQNLKDSLPLDVQQRCVLRIEPQFHAHRLQALSIIVRHTQTIDMPQSRITIVELIDVFCKTATVALAFAEDHEL